MYGITRGYPLLVPRKALVAVYVIMRYSWRYKTLIPKGTKLLVPKGTKLLVPKGTKLLVPHEVFVDVYLYFVD
jgi:hypothetical protein